MLFPIEIWKLIINAMFTDFRVCTRGTDPKLKVVKVNKTVLNFTQVSKLFNEILEKQIQEHMYIVYAFSQTSYKNFGSYVKDYTVGLINIESDLYKMNTVWVYYKDSELMDRLYYVIKRTFCEHKGSYCLIIALLADFEKFFF